MPRRAHVTSVDSLDAFRSSLIVYLEKAAAAADDAMDDVSRTRGWLQGERRMFWETEVRKRTKRLEQLQQQLFSARFATLGEHTTAQQLAVSRAKRELDEARARLDAVKKWSRHFDGETAPLVKLVEKLRAYMARDLKLAVAHLGELVKTLEAYSERAVAAGTVSPPPAATREEAEVTATATTPATAANGGVDA